MGFLDALPAIAGTGIGALAGGPVGAMIGGSIGGAVSSSLGQSSANQANWDTAVMSNTMAQQNAREQMDFQKSMSNTAHQREVDDLQKAGLNPILSANAGASSPAGASGGTTAGAAQQSTTGDLTAQLAQAAQFSQQMSQQNAQIENTKANTALALSQKLKTDVDAKVATKGVPEADLKNKFYDVIRPLLDKLKGAGQSGAKIYDNFKNDYNNSNIGRQR